MEERWGLGGKDGEAAEESGWKQAKGGRCEKHTRKLRHGRVRRRQSRNTSHILIPVVRSSYAPSFASHTPDKQKRWKKRRKKSQGRSV